MRPLTPAVLALLCPMAAAQPLATGPAVRYDGHKLVAVDLATVGDVRTMQDIGADQWSSRVIAGVPTDFLVSPAQLDALDATGLRYEVLIDDIQTVIDEESERLRGGERTRGWYDDFKDLAAINDYLDVLAGTHPDLATVFDVGLTLEGRTVRGVRISDSSFGDPACKPTLLFNAGQHAREWIGPMVAMYAADQLLTLHGADPDVTELLERAEIIIIPVLNADGYEYSWTTQRLWRKNRRDNGDGTFGVDLNRNWGYQWGRDYGSSGNTGSNTYRGTAPFSEPETQILRDLALALPRLAGSMDLHSAGQWILAPWGWTSDPPPDHETYQLLGAQMQQIIQSVHDRLYRHGPIFTSLYAVSGCETDWFWGELGVHNMAFELRGPGFAPPPEEILPNAEEIFPALLYFSEWARLERKPIGDFNDDARNDTQDVVAFLDAWAAGESAADIDSNGVIDTRDAVAMLNAWAGGC